MNTAMFRTDDLVKLDEDDYCVLASGGPLMHVDRAYRHEDGHTLVDCSWGPNKETLDARCVKRRRCRSWSDFGRSWIDCLPDYCPSQRWRKR